MIHLLYIFLLLFCSLFLELYIGSYSIIIPFIAVVIFYLTIIYDIKKGIILAVIAGCLLDNLYGRAFYISPITLPLVSIFAVFWLRKGIIKNIYFQLLPGIIISFIYAFPCLAINYCLYESGFLVFFIDVLILLSAVISGIVLLPAVILLLDSISIKLNIDLYINAKKRLTES